MPATTSTNELFPRSTTTLAQVKARQDLAIKAGAIRSTIDSQSDPANFLLTTEWNVVGMNDDDAWSVPQHWGPAPAFRATALAQAKPG